MFDWIKNLFYFKVKPLINTTTPFTPSVQEDPRTVQSVKNTRKAFKQQEAAMQMMAMKAHAAECNDTFTCSAEPCFIREPDKIVKTETVSAERYNNIRKKNMKRLKGMKKT
jgi:hypothetical protein